MKRYLEGRGGEAECNMICSQTKVRYTLQSGMILDMCLSQHVCTSVPEGKCLANAMPFTLSVFPVVSVLAACA